MSASTPRIPRIDPELIPLLDAALPRTEPPRRQTPQELANLRAGLRWAIEEFGQDSDVVRRCLLVVALEHSRAEAIP
jgi:hypothetical protein